MMIEMIEMTKEKYEEIAREAMIEARREFGDTAILVITVDAINMAHDKYLYHSNLRAHDRMQMLMGRLVRHLPEETVTAMQECREWIQRRIEEKIRELGKSQSL